MAWKVSLRDLGQCESEWNIYPSPTRSIQVSLDLLKTREEYGIELEKCSFAPAADILIIVRNHWYAYFLLHISQKFIKFLLFAVKTNFRGLTCLLVWLDVLV